MKTTLHHRLWHRIRRAGVPDSLLATCTYAVIALIVFYPVPFRLNSALAGFNGRDGWEHAWWLWFAKRLMLEGQGLNNLYLLNHPVGLQHPYQWSLASYSLMAGLVGLVLPPAATFNTMALGSFVLSGLAAYHLCRELTGDTRAAVVGGAIFAFCPNRLGHALAGWLPQMTAFLYPWYALALIRTIRKPTALRGVGLGILAAVSALVWPMHIAYFILPLTLTIAGAELLRLRRDFFTSHRVQHVGLALVICVAVVFPFLRPLLVGRLTDNLNYLSTHGIVQHSTELLAFFTPSPYHPILAPSGLIPRFAQRVIDEVQTLRWDSAYVGLVPGLLALWGLVGGRPRPWRWFVLFIGAALLSLGPILVLAGEPFDHTVDGYESRVLLPYAIVRQVPLLDWGRTPGRLNTTGMLGLGVLASYGLSRLFTRKDKRQLKAHLLTFVVLAVIIFEYLPLWPFPTGDATIPSVIDRIAASPGDGAVLHVPMDRRVVNNRALFYQTTTEKPIVGGVVLRTLPAVPPWQQTIERLVRATPDQDAVPRPTLAQRRAWLEHLDVDWVVLDRFFPEDEEQYRPFIEKVLGPAVAEDSSLTAFSVPDDPSPLESSYLYTFSDQGWHRAEQDGGVWRRWMYNDGQLYIYAAHDATGILRFNVASHLDFPVMEVYKGDRLLDTFIVGDRTTYATRPITLTTGMNVFRFHGPAGCPEVLDDPRCWGEALLEAPGEAYPPCDGRTSCRTFVFDSVSFVEEDDLAPGESTAINFGDQLELRGWSLERTTLDPGDTLTVTLTWEAKVKPTNRHVVFAHLLSSDGEMVAQHDDAPVGSVVPSAAWQAGATFQYPASVALPHDLSAGTYRLLVGVYVWPEIERLPILSDTLTSDDNVLELGRVEITP